MSDTNEKRKVIHSEGRGIIAKVFHYFQQEYKFMKENNHDNCDLAPLGNVRKRTAQATGVSERTVTTILKEEKELPKEEEEERRKTSASACKHKWQGLRDAYRRALNKRKQRMSEEPTAKIKKWKFEDEISYLNKYLGEKKKAAPIENDGQNECDDETVSNSDFEGSSECPKKEREEIEHPENIEQYNIVAMDPANLGHSPSNTIPNSIQNNSLKWVNSQLSPSSYVTANYSEDVPKEYKEPEVSHDQMDLFFLNLSNTVKTFSPYLQAIAKNKIFNLVSELEIQQLAPSTSNNISTIPQTSNCPIAQHQQNSAQVCVKLENSVGE